MNRSSNDVALTLADSANTLQARGGELILLNGPSGSGKSLWLHRMAELAALPPDITIRLTHANQDAPAVRMLFDRWPAIWLGQTVKEELMFGLNRQPAPQLLDRALQQWGLSEIAQSTELQMLNRLQSLRLSLAAMSLADPALVLLDNPTAALCEKDAQAVIRDIQDWRQQTNTIVVVACNRWQDWRFSASQCWRVNAPDALPLPGGPA